MKHLKSILQQQEKMLQLVRQACGDKLSDCVLMVPDFEEKIISQMRWGLFMPERVPGKLLDKVSSTYRHTSDDLLRIDFDEICLVQDFIKSTPELMQKDMFSPKIPSMAGKALAVDMDYEELNVFCDEVEMPKSKASVEEILDYVVLLFKDKDKEQKYQVLNNALKNNKLYINTFEQKNRLYQFVNLHIDAQYRENFSHLYQEVGKFNTHQVNLFNYPSNILNIDLHKVSFSQCFKIKASDTYITKFLNSLVYLVEKKETIKLLGATSLEVTQKTQAYDYYRLVLTPVEGKKLDANLIESYIKNVIEAYSKAGAPEKSLLSSINKKIVLSMGLHNALETKTDSAKKKKI